MEKAEIFLAGERGLCETADMRSYRSFNFGDFYNEHKAGFSDLYVFNDETLAPGHSITMHIDRKSQIFILPVVGQVDYANDRPGQVSIQPGQLFVSTVDSGSSIQLKNPFDEELINFIQIRIAVNDSASGVCKTGLWHFDLNHIKNGLAEIVGPGDGLSMPVSIGKFSGRQEILYPLKNENNGVYAFVLEGAFELQNRLLHARDGLAIWGASAIEAEALSDDAIVLLLELPLRPSE